ncbi:MAG: FIST N-terminal domain-containing protein, partial [Paracoccaceae bacterium]
MHILVDALAEADTETALATLLERVRARDAAPPSFLAVHASARHDPAAVQRAARTAGVETLHGGTSCLGVMAGGRLFAEAGFGIFALWDEAGGYGSAAASGPDGRAVGREAARGALAAAGRPGEAPDLVWLTAAPGTEEAVLAGIEDVVGASTPILGGSAADDTIAGGWAAYDARAVEPGGVVVSALFPSRPVSWAYSSGYVPA